MIVGERVRQVREFRNLKGKELAAIARISAPEVSQVEQGHRTPRVDILQKIAAALEVSVSYLLGEEDEEVSLGKALARQSLKKYLRSVNVSEQDQEYLRTVARRSSAPVTTKGWKDLLENVSLYQKR